MYILLMTILVLMSCESDQEKREAEIAKIPIEVKVTRFDRVFAKSNPSDLPQLKKEYSYLFPKRFPDSLWISKMTDSIQAELNEETEKAFPNLDTEKKDLHALFQHLKYYFPAFKTPTVVTITSNVDYKNKVVAADSLVILSLDTYLGPDHRFYLGIAQYIRKNFRKEEIMQDVAAEYGRQLVPKPKSRSLLAHMVYYGKILYLKDRVLPQTTDANKIGYTPEEMDWAEANEQQIWRYFIEKEYLYNTDNRLQARFLNMGPFTKFGLQLDNDSPPQLGQFIGWQIVREYAEKHPEVSLNDILKMDGEQLFNESNYKPKKPA